MQRDPPKKKKKYVPSNKPNHSQSYSQSKTFISNSQIQGKALERSRFDYTFEEIINHLLARLLPNSNYTIKLSQKLIFGEQRELDNFIMKLDDNIKYTSGFTIELKEGVDKQDIDYKMEEHYRGKTFNYKLIHMSVGQFFAGTKYQREYDSFLGQFKDTDRKKIYVRLNREYYHDFVQDIQDKTVVVDKGEVEGQGGRRRRGNRTLFKKEIDSIEIDSDVFNLNNMYKFFSKSQKLDRNDLVVTKIRNEYDQIQSYKIDLMSYQQDERKKEGFNYYFRHLNFIELPLKDSNHKKEIIREYGDISKSYLRTEVISGYKSSKWEDKSIMYKIRTKQIGNKKSKYLNQYFQAICLKGLLPVVRQHLEELEKQINEVPLDDIEEEVSVEFDERIKDYIRDSQDIKQFVENFVRKYILQFQKICTIDKIKFPLRGVKLTLKIKNNSVQQFQNIKNNIEKVMPKYIALQKVSVDFMIDKQFEDKLQEEKILVVDVENKSFTYITSTEDLDACVKVVQKIIRQFESIGEQSISVVGMMKKIKYLEVIHNLKKQNKEYNHILVPEPTTEDKINFKITFYGPRKKNDRFLMEVKEKIATMERQLGQYSQFIDEKVGKLIVEDRKIQEQIEKEMRISLILGGCTLEGRFEVCSKKKSEIYVIKGSNLEKIPLGSFIFLENKTSMKELKQKYLQNLKSTIKKTRGDKWLCQTQKTRNYNFLFKQNFTLRDMLNQSSSRHKNKEETISIGLLMPKINKKQWLKKLFDILSYDGQLSKISFKIFIMESQEISSLEKLVDIPQYSPFTTDNEQILVQWFCEDITYSKFANSKINDAIANCMTSVILDKQCIDYDQATHICDLGKNTIAYKAMGGGIEQTPFYIGNKQITFKYKGHDLKFPQSEYNKVIYHQKLSQQSRFFVSLPFYLIDLVKFKQVNLFSNYQRKITKKQTKITLQQDFKGVIKAFYNQKMTQLIYSFKQQDSKMLQPAVAKMTHYIKQHWHRQIIPIKEISEISFKDLLKQRLETRAQEYSLRYQFDPLMKCIQVESFNLKDIDRFRNIMQSQVQYLVNLSKKSVYHKNIQAQFLYPEDWNKQSNPVQTFEVQKNTKEFKMIQQLWMKERPISQVIRIQNQYIYKKYLDELEHLTHMNGSEPKQMKLFHGTGNTSPEVVWADKEDGFNINYSSDSNLLGRGIYFAEKSQYSWSYKSDQGIINGKKVYSMLLCLVIVGDSQEMKMSHVNRNVKDTDFKANGMRYESMKGKHHMSDIYVVYKTRRAYPLYVIHFT